MVEHGFVNLDRDERVAVEKHRGVPLCPSKLYPACVRTSFYLLVAVEIGVDIYIRHLAHILGRIELGEASAPLRKICFIPADENRFSSSPRVISDLHT